MVHKTLLVSAALAASALAQQAPVVTVLLPLGYKDTRYVGSVISADAGTTSMSVTCDAPPASTATGEAAYCQLGDKFGAKFAPSSVDFSMGLTASMDSQLIFARTMSAHCLFSNKDTMTCTAVVTSQGGESSGATIPQVETATEVLTNLSDLYYAVTVTAGAERLTGGTPAATPTPSGSGSGSTGQTAGNGVSAPTGSPTTGGMPRMTQNAVLAGVAAVVGGVAML